MYAPVTNTGNGNLLIRGTPVLEKNLLFFNDPTVRYLVNQGGSRSSKTFSIAQMLILTMLKEQHKIITIARKTFPSLRQTVMRDFFELLEGYERYDEEAHDMTNHIYEHGTNIVEFVSLDQPQKKRGSKRNILWMNETNEFGYEDYMQLNIRTTEKIIMDYNPSEMEHFIYDKVLPRPDARLIKSTYLDNTFLEQSLIDELERLREDDETYWKIYGLGEQAAPTSLIYNNWTIVSALPESTDTIIYGLDFGFQNPTSLIQVAIADGKVYVDECLYETKLTNADVIERIRATLPNRRAAIYADHAEPQRIEEIYRAGFNIHAANKDVAVGIDLVKRYRLHITSRSVNLLREIKQYKWKQDKNGHVLDEPLKFLDHAMDALRYAMFSHFKKYGARAFGSEGRSVGAAARSRRSVGSAKRRGRGSDEFSNF
jgi:phage terminase large subunit